MAVSSDNTKGFPGKEFSADPSLLQNQHTEVLIRKSDTTTKQPLKEKFVAVYESFFMGQNPSIGNANFWDELFLLKVNHNFLERCIILTSEEQLLSLKDNINLIFGASCAFLKDTNYVKVKHAIETLCILLKSLFKKKFGNFGVDILNIITGIEKADIVFKDMLSSINALLQSTADIESKQLAVHLLLIIVTASDNVNQNTLIEYLMLVDISASLLQIFEEDSTPESLSFESLVLFLLLLNYRKYEIQNPYASKLTMLNNYTIIERICYSIACNFMDCCSAYERTMPASNSGLLGKLGINSVFTLFNSSTDVEPMNSSNSGIALLALYELVQLNRAFVPFMVNTKEVLELDAFRPLDLLSQFLTLSSFTFATMNDMRSISYSRLCLIIMECCAEDKALLQLLHDNSVCPTTRLFIKSKKTCISYQKPLAYPTVEVLLQFLKCNTKKSKFDQDLFSKCFATLQRILIFEHQTKSTLDLRWNELWASLFLLIQFISSESTQDKPELMALSLQIARLFNIFITFGENLLSPAQYDELYYELIRNRSFLDALFMLVAKVDSSDQSPLAHEWSNIKTIVNHFGSMIDVWCAANPSSSLSQEKVQAIIRSNYDSLRLKLLENLEWYEPYNENPKEVAFFRQLTRVLVFDWKTAHENSLRM